MADYKTYMPSAVPLSPARVSALKGDARQHLFQARAARQRGDLNTANAHLTEASTQRDKAAGGTDGGFYPYRSSHVFGDIQPNRKLP